jgi:hypothetical protein
MQPAFDSSTLDRLIALGRKQGHLTNQDLEANLPIASMNAEEIALIVVHLEETGIPVELDDSLISPNGKQTSASARSAEIIPFPDRAAAAWMRRRTAPLQKAHPSQPDAVRSTKPGKRSAHWAVALSGLLVLVLLIGLVMMLGV